MKVKFLGTIASEGGPALFCNCDYCKKARELGGKNIRTRSQILINENLLIDFPADTYLHKLKYNLDLTKVKNLLITHSHEDHFYPMDLYNVETCCCARNKVEPILHVHCNQSVFDRAKYVMRDAFAIDGIAWNIIKEFQKVDLGEYEAYSLRAKHMLKENALFYLIKEGNKAFLQANDTGIFDDENYEYLKSLNIKLNLVSLDCAMGQAPANAYFGHMGLEDCFNTIERLKRENLVLPTTRYILTHFSHNGGILMHEDYEKICRPKGVEVAYDGMEVEL